VAETLVLGLGNILLGDEGIGVRVVERLLEQYDLPKGVQAMDGGTLGMALLPYLEDASRLVLVDAVQAHKAPGSLLRLSGDEILRFLDEPPVSPYQDNLQNLLAVAMVKGYLPDEVVFWGVHIESPGIGLELSPSVATRVDAVVEKVLEELARWGIQVHRRAY
jgi:hydrogenase maturation protease